AGKVFACARLHPRGDFFGEKFEKEVWHGTLARIGIDAAASAICGTTQANLSPRNVMRSDFNPVAASRFWALISRLLPVMNGQDCDKATIEAIAYNIAALSKRNEPIAKFRWHVFDRTPDLRMRTERFYALSDRANCTLCSIAVFWRKESMEAGHVLQGGRRPNQLRHGLLVRNWRLRVLTCFETLKPRIGLLRSDMPACALKIRPSSQRVLFQPLARLFPFDILLDCRAHKPMRGAPAQVCQTAKPFLEARLTLQAGCGR